MIRRIFKYLVYLAILGALGVIVYAYVGPHIGEDFSRPQQDIRQQIEFDAQ